MRKATRILAIMLSAVMLMGLLISCGESGNKQDKTGVVPQSGSSTEAAVDPDALPEFPLAKPITINAMMTENAGVYKDVLAMEEFTKRTGIKIKFDLSPVNDYKEKQRVILASGNLPDAMCLVASEASIIRDIAIEYGSQGMLVNFKDYMDKMPNLQNWIEKFPKMKIGVEDKDGNLYAIASGTNSDAVYESLLINEIAFQKNDLPIPTTVDEFYDTLKKLKEIYPESTPFVIRWGLWHVMDPMSRMFSTLNDIYYNEDQKQYIYGPIEDNYKKSIQFLNKLYNDKLLDPEFTSLSDEQWSEKLLNEKGFVTFDYKHETRLLPDTIQTAGVSQNKDNFKLVPIAPLINEGKQTKYWGSEAINLGWGMAINAKSKYVKELVKLMDWQLTDEYITLASWGIEGVSYNVVDGKKAFVDNLKTAKNPDGTIELADVTNGYVGLFPMGDNSCDQIGGAYDLYFSDEIIKYGSFPTPWELPFSRDDLEKKANFLTPAKTTTDEWTIRFIINDKSFDEWDDYVKKIKALGVDDILKMYNDKLADINH